MDNSTPTSVSRFTDFDISLFKSGKHYRLYEKLGSHLMEVEGVHGVYFAVWAPSARSISVVGNFNTWNIHTNRMLPRWDGSGIWELFVPNVKKGDVYKYSILTSSGHYLQKGDPFALKWETPPKTASVVWDTWFEWEDSHWMMQRHTKNSANAPQSIYEVHLGSWRKIAKENNRSLSYIEMADSLVKYVKEMGFTHVEFMPVMEHPFYGSWGYQVTGFFAPSSRYGIPQDLMFLIQRMHQEGIGVILDWVPSHFPTDAHGLANFDGTNIYEHSDPRQGYHPDWKSLIFNYGRYEVRSFLISNALFWLDRYHADGLRVDAVASMLYLDYSRKAGEWIPNLYGGNENLEAVSFLREFNTVVYKEYPDVITIAEESTAWQGVSRPTYTGGLGFGEKWMMGWMHDTLDYLKRDILYRRFHQNQITFSIIYAFAENFVLPLSHDEVVHGKGSLLGRMPGDSWQRFANLRFLFAYMYTHPGMKMIFMGGEFGQFQEWSHDRGLDWDETSKPLNQGVQNMLKDLNALYRTSPALHEMPFNPETFEWISLNDVRNCVVVYLRKGFSPSQSTVIVACNAMPTLHEHYAIGVPFEGNWEEVFNTDNTKYGGSGQINTDILQTSPVELHKHKQSIGLRLPPLGISIIAYKGSPNMHTEVLEVVKEETISKKEKKNKKRK